jgi:hypothetical protein
MNPLSFAAAADNDGNEPPAREYNAVMQQEATAVRRPLAPCGNGSAGNDVEDSLAPEMIPWTEVWNGTWLAILSWLSRRFYTCLLVSLLGTLGPTHTRSGSLWNLS